MHVSIGPSAGVCCYEVDEPVLKELRNEFRNCEKVVKNNRNGKAHLDLKSADP